MFWLLFSASPWPFRLFCLFIMSAARLLTCIWPMTIFSYKQPEAKGHFYGSCFCATTKKKTKKEKSRGKCKIFHWHSMAFLRRALRVAPMHSNHWEKNALLYWDRAMGRIRAVAWRGFKHITIKYFIFVALFLVNTLFSSKNDIFILPRTDRRKAQKTLWVLVGLLR